MAAFLQFKPFHTSKVWRFPDPDSGYMNVAENKADLIKSIVSYRGNNRLPPIEQLPRVLENYLCGLPENCGSCEPKPLERGFLMTLRGGMALLEWVTFPHEHTATQEEAEKRAEQCAACKFNVFPDKGPFVAWADDIALACIGDKKTSWNAVLGNCEVCSCVLRAKVFYKGDPKFTPEQREQAASVNCWQLQVPWRELNVVERKELKERQHG